MKLEQLTKVNLGEYPTPLEKMNNLTKVLGKGALYVKRDDATGPALGGNKTRKLEYIVARALEQGCTTLLTMGGTQTNHGRTTVGAAAKFGLKSILALAGPKPAYLSGNLTLDAMMGAELMFVKDPVANMKQAIADVIAAHEAKGEKVYNMPAGGSSIDGIPGYIMTVPEIMKQIEEQGLKTKYVVCALGSMGTYAGLCIGAKYFKAGFKVIGIPVSPGPDKRGDVADFANKACEYYDLGISFTADEFIVNNGPEASPFSGEAYNKPDSLTRDYMNLIAREEGLILDPTYTGKVFRGYVELVKNGVIEANSDPIFLHTGGAPAVWTKEHLDDAQQQLAANCNMFEV